jgi:hypothetical protein
MLTNYTFPKILHAGSENVDKAEDTEKYDN